MNSFNSVLLMADAKKTAKLKNHNIGNFQILGDEKYSAKCTVCSKMLYLNDLIVSGEVFDVECQKPVKLKKKLYTSYTQNPSFLIISL